MPEVNLKIVEEYANSDLVVHQDGGRKLRLFQPDNILGGDWLTTRSLFSDLIVEQFTNMRPLQKGFLII